MSLFEGTCGGHSRSNTRPRLKTRRKSSSTIICIRPCMQINDFDLYFGCIVGQSVQIGMKLELDVWHHPLNVYVKFQTDISKHVQKSLENFSLAGSSSNTSVFVCQRAKNCPTNTKISRDQDTQNISVCTKSEASIWFLRPLMQINDFDMFWLLSRSKCPDWNETRTWRVTPPTACIYQVWNWYLKTCRKKPRKLRKIQNMQKWSPKFESNIFPKKRNLCREVCSRPPVYQIWRIYLDLWGHDCKKWVWLTFGCKLGESDPIVMQLDVLCHLLNVYTKFEIDISKHVKEKSGKRGRTNGQTDGHCHGIIRPFFKRAYKSHSNTQN